MFLDQTTILVGVFLLLAAYVKGTTGMGFPLIATPMVVLLLDIRTAITILIIPNIVMDIGQPEEERHLRGLSFGPKTLPILRPLPNDRQLK